MESWKDVFRVTETERIAPETFCTIILDFINDVEKIYGNSIKESELKKLSKLKDVFSFDSLLVYQNSLLEMIEILNKLITCNENSDCLSKKMKLAMEYIHENYAKDLNMAVVSNYISMNYSLFSYSFKQYTGSSFVYYLRNLRIEEAKRLLVETDLKIIEISQAVGYDNEKNFMKIFKKTYGVSASEFRRNMRKHTV